MPSAKSAASAAKNAVQTAKSAVQTAKNAVQTAKNAASAAQNAVQTAKNAVQTATWIPRSEILRQYVRCFWMLKSPATDDAAGTLIHPEPCFDAILNYGDSTNWRGLHTGPLHLKGSFLCGIREDSYEVLCRGGKDYLAIRFQPLGLRPFVNFPLSEMGGKTIEMDLLDRTVWKRITERTADIPRIEKRLETVEAMLLDALGRSIANPAPELKPLFSEFHGSGGRIRLREICFNSGMSQKRLVRAFRNHIGVPPKYFLRVIRFNRAVDRLLGTPGPPDWATLVYTLGYFDQAHMIKEFKEFTGMTPGLYRNSLLAPESL
jgi:AraC-like DNA-binding protein